MRELALPLQIAAEVIAPRTDSGAWGGEWGDTGSLRQEHTVVDFRGNLLPVQGADLRAVPDWARGGRSVRGFLSGDLLKGAVELYRKISPDIRQVWSFDSATSHLALEDLAAGNVRKAISRAKPPRLHIGAMLRSALKPA